MKAYYPGQTFMIILPDGMGEVKRVTICLASRHPHHHGRTLHFTDTSHRSTDGFVQDAIEVGPLPDDLCPGVNELKIESGRRCFYQKINLITRGPKSTGIQNDSLKRVVEQVCCPSDIEEDEEQEDDTTSTP